MTEDALDAIVVGRQDLGEADRIVRLLTPSEGRVDLLARGARRSARRFAGALEPGTRLRVTRKRGRGALATLVDADVVRTPRRPRDDYGLLVALAYGCEVAAALSREGLGADKGFGLLEVWLDCLEAPTAPGLASRLAYEAKALTFAGLAPALTRCAVCGGALLGTVRWSEEAGGGLHVDCGAGEAVDAAELATLDALRRTPLADTITAAGPAGSAFRLAGFIEHHTRRALVARRLLEDLP